MKICSLKSSWRIASLALASTAVFIAPPLASAADLPSGKAAPVAYLKICDVYGSGFFTIPGSDTCLRIGALVRADYEYVPGRRMINVATGVISQTASAQDKTGFEARAVLRIDARTPTELGPVRTYIQLRGTSATGLRRTTVPGNFGLTYPGGVVDSPIITVERAFVEWNGFKFGRIPGEYFNWPSGSIVGYIGDFTPGWSNGLNGISYTRSLGGGFKMILSLEDRAAAAHNADAAPGTPAGIPPGLSVPTSALSTIVVTPTTGYNLTANLQYEQSWGSLQGGGMWGNNSTTNGANPASNVLPAATLATMGIRTYTSWATYGNLQIKLPMIAAGDEFWLGAAYGVGSLGYVTGDSWNTLTGDAPNRRVLGGVQVNPSNLVAVSADTCAGAAPQICLPTAWRNSRSWMVMGLFTHYWTPTLRSHMMAGFLQYLPPTAFNPVAPPALVGTLNTQLGKSSVWQVKSNLIWSPAKDFDIGVEVGYGRMSASIQNPTAAFVAAGQPGLRESNWISKMRVQRGF